MGSKRGCEMQELEQVLGVQFTHVALNNDILRDDAYDYKV